MSAESIMYVSLLVNDYDEAIHFYTTKLGFILVEDTKLSATKRWVLISPQGNSSTKLLLAKAATDEQRTRVGNQTGGRVFLFLKTNNFEHDLDQLIQSGVKIVREASKEPYGKVAVFADLYGNLWDLIEPANDAT